MKTYRVLAINPGSTSTKIAVFDNEEEVFSKTLQHKPEELSGFAELIDQFEFRKNIVEEALEENNIHVSTLNAIVGRGGLVHPVASGTYKVNDKMLADLKDKSLWGRTHASNLGAFIAKSIGDEFDIPSFIADPVTVDEMDDIARISGVPEIQRQSLFHALNIKSIARKSAEKIGKPLDKCNMIAVHMGGGVSVAAIRDGKIVDVNNALLGMGPFSPQRAGALPISGVINLCFSGKYTKEELEKKLVKNSGLIAYLGTDSGVDIENKIDEGNEKFEKIFRAFAYQISKEIGLCATVLKGDVDAIYLTGGLAYDKYLPKWIIERTKFIAPVLIFPGEGEMEALAQAGVRALSGEEAAKKY
ncbi:MAG: butyrate kinase [Candidatus Cloacimonadota bacterium]|nr:butyrate kinase [Candidatus Cloacimonadota bacterium]